MAGPRPGGVTLVAVLAIISGAFQTLGGILILIGAGVEPSALLTTVGIITLVIGVLTIIVGAYLLGGSRLARMLVTISLVLSIASAIFTMFSAPGQFWSAIISGLIALLGIVLLWSRRASDFFNS